MRPRPRLVRLILTAALLLGVRTAAAQQPPPQTAPPPPYPPPTAYAPPPAGYPPPPGYYPPGYAPPPPAAPLPPPPEKRVGVGYKIGNGLGFIGGDIIVSPIDHLGFDLQVNYQSADSMFSGTASGYGFAPAVQGRWFAGQRSTPYAALGFLHSKMTFGGQSGTSNGFFVNAGYEWRWESGFGILLGAGVSNSNTLRLVSGLEGIEKPGGVRFNLEFGLRWMFI